MPFFAKEHIEFRAEVRETLAKIITPHIEEWEQGTYRPHDVFPLLAASGLLGLEYDPADGGRGLDHRHTVIFGEELGRAGSNGAAMSISIQTDMATPSLAAFGSERIRARYLQPSLRGELVGCVAITEPHAGSDVANIRSSAVRDGDTWVVNGRKRYITNGADADWVCALVLTGPGDGVRGMSQIVIPTHVPGFSVVRAMPKLGGRAVRTVELAFEDCRIPLENTVGEVGNGFRQQMRHLERERMIANYIAVGEAEAAIERTLTFLHEREVFGRPLAQSQHLQFEMAELVAELDVLRKYNYSCAQARLDGVDAQRETAIAKLTAGRLVRKISDRCLQFHGGLGYDDSHWSARYFRDARVLSIGGGTDEVMLRILARMEGMPTVF